MYETLYLTTFLLIGLQREEKSVELTISMPSALISAHRLSAGRVHQPPKQSPCLAAASPFSVL